MDNTVNDQLHEIKSEKNFFALSKTFIFFQKTNFFFIILGKYIYFLFLKIPKNSTALADTKKHRHSSVRPSPFAFADCQGKF